MLVVVLLRSAHHDSAFLLIKTIMGSTLKRDEVTSLLGNRE